jgi:heme-degrading monooxygenase HmoA
MIARIWRGHTRASDAESYTKLVERMGLADYRATPGNLGAAILRRVEAPQAGDARRPPSPQGTAEFLVLSFWESLDAIRRFAGPDVEKAHYYPEDDAYLLGKEPRVTHYELAARVGPVLEASEEKLPAVRVAGEEA